MPDLAASAITTLDRWTEGGLTGKRHVVKRVTLNLTGQGGTTNRILASTLGFKRILEVSVGVDAGNTDMFLACPSVDGSMLLFNDPSVASNVPADITDTVTLNVKGIA